jgi:DNA-binding NarL/FixJ family response regulator
MKNTDLAMILSGVGAELFTYNGLPLVATNRRIYEVHEAPVSIKNTITNYINACDDRKSAYTEMVGLDQNDQIAQCIKCMFANLDGTPDIDVNGNIHTEYVPCPKRGQCKYEGVACNRLMIGTAKITKSQERVVSHCASSYKEIAGKLFISVQTVKRHMQDVLKETGIPDKTNLALTAKEMGILN